MAFLSRKDISRPPETEYIVQLSKYQTKQKVLTVGQSTERCGGGFSETDGCFSALRIHKQHTPYFHAVLFPEHAQHVQHRLNTFANVPLYSWGTREMFCLFHSETLKVLKELKDAVFYINIFFSTQYCHVIMSFPSAAFLCMYAILQLLPSNTAETEVTCVSATCSNSPPVTTV